LGYYTKFVLNQLKYVFFSFDQKSFDQKLCFKIDSQKIISVKQYFWSNYLSIKQSLRSKNVSVKWSFRSNFLLIDYFFQWMAWFVYIFDQTTIWLNDTTVKSSFGVEVFNQTDFGRMLLESFHAKCYIDFIMGLQLILRRSPIKSFF
jgi:hypothetical protein